MHEPAGGAGLRAPGPGGSSRPAGTPSMVSRSRSPKLAITSTPTVYCARPRRAASREAVPMPPLKPRQLIPVPAPTAPSAGGRRRRPPARAAVQRGAARRRRLDLHPAGVGQEAVVALGHDRDDHVVGADARVLGHHQLAGRVVDPADLHRRGQEDRRLGQPPLGGGQEAGALAGAVEHRAAGRDRAAEQVAARVEHRHAGAGDPAARRAAAARRARRWHGPRPRRARRRSIRSGRSAARRSVIPRSAARVMRRSCRTGGPGPWPARAPLLRDTEVLVARQLADDPSRLRIPVIWNEDCLLHGPTARYGSASGRPGTEVPERAEVLLAAVRAAGAEVLPARAARRRGAGVGA